MYRLQTERIILTVLKWSKVYRRCNRETLTEHRCETSCTRGDTICPRPSPPPIGAVAPRAAELTAAPADGNVAAVSHAQYVPTLTAAAACA